MTVSYQMDQATWNIIKGNYDGMLEIYIYIYMFPLIVYAFVVPHNWKLIYFSLLDKTLFYLNVHVNTQNNGHFCTGNPLYINSIPFYKLNVYIWCTISARRIIVLCSVCKNSGYIFSYVGMTIQSKWIY